MSEEKQDEELKELVLARIGIMPPNLKLSIGNFGTFTKQEMIEHVKCGDAAGKQIIQMQISFIKALTSGRLIEILNKNE
ncbi:hypothetical protein HYW76_01885 [Candidatus Pacearchaeota archaeon]|nr:hypothetical protein [Candidatus Pacearchaeota archaeon]